MRENADQKHGEYGHFLRSVYHPENIFTDGDIKEDKTQICGSCDLLKVEIGNEREKMKDFKTLQSTNYKTLLRITKMYQRMVSVV